MCIHVNKDNPAKSVCWYDTKWSHFLSFFVCVCCCTEWSHFFFHVCCCWGCHLTTWYCLNTHCICWWCLCVLCRGCVGGRQRRMCNLFWWFGERRHHRPPPLPLCLPQRVSASGAAAAVWHHLIYCHYLTSLQLYMASTCSGNVVIICPTPCLKNLSQNVCFSISSLGLISNGFIFPARCRFLTTTQRG